VAAGEVISPHGAPPAADSMSKPRLGRCGVDPALNEQVELSVHPTVEPLQRRRPQGDDRRLAAVASRASVAAMAWFVRHDPSPGMDKVETVLGVVLR